MWMRLALASLVALAPSFPRTAGACQPYPSYGLHALDGTYADDTTPPVLENVHAEAWEENYSYSGCGGEPTCGNPALIHVVATATDDRAPAGQIGLRFTITSGEPPRGLVVPSESVSPFGDLGLRYSDDAPSGWSFEMEVRAVDLNGNESEPVLVRVAD